MSKFQKVTLPVSGMHCASCASVISKKISKLEGVKSCDINYASEKAKIEFDQDRVSVGDMNSEIEKLGYKIHSDNMNHNVHEGHDMMTPLTSDLSSKEIKLKELNSLKNKVLLSLPMVFVTILSMFSMNMVFSYLLPIFATYSLFVIGTPYIKGVINFAKYRVANMDTLVGIGTTVAYIYSIYSEIAGRGEHYFDVTIVVIGFITLGKYLEARSKLKTGEAIESLLSLQVKKAILLKNGKEIEVLIENIKVGDILLVKPGQKIPLDGIVVNGNSSIDESMITGESMPVDKKIGDSCVGSTINKQGSLEIKVTRIGKDTVLSQIIKMVEEAQSSKASIENLADKVSSIFVPVVIVVSLVVSLLWLISGNPSVALSSFVGILVIACPCAMGLATPTAIIVGVGKAAKNGILIKNAEYLEKLSKVNYVVFDKTGTLTKGNPEVKEFINISEFSDDKLLNIIGSIENKSEHPLSKAIVNYTINKSKLNLTVSDFKALDGMGIKAKINSDNFIIGNVALANDNNVEIDIKVIERFTKNSYTPVIVAKNKKLLAYLSISDALKENSIHSIEELQKMNIRTAMLTGDNKNTAENFARLLKIDNVIAEVKPKDKAENINKIKKDGYIVAMVGDGINDAPALALSDVGVAMGTGTDVAIESAGITLLGGNVSKVPQAIKISRSTMKTVKENLFWAFFYNIIGIPVAAGILYPSFGILLSPAVAGSAMAFSSVSVVLNSLRLKTLKWT